MTPQQDGGDTSKSRPRANTTNFSSFSSWLRDRPSLPSPNPMTSSQPSLPLGALIEVLTPPNQPSLAHARGLAGALSVCSPVPRPLTLCPILASLCHVHAPVALQAAGYEIIYAYYENHETAACETADRLAYFSLFSEPPKEWSQELWEPRFRALRALTKYGTEISGLEADFVGVLQAWIQAAFDGLIANRGLDSSERAERERTLEVLAQFLTDVLDQPAIVARLSDAELVGIVRFYGSLVDQAIAAQLPSPSLRRGASMPPPSSPDSSIFGSSPSRPTLSHKRHPSSVSISSLHRQFLQPSVVSKHSVNLTVGIYLNYLGSKLKTLSPNVLDMILPLLFRALSCHATPLPRLSITSPSSTPSAIEAQITETLDALLSGPYATLCMTILRRYLSPPAFRGENVDEAIQTAIGAQRTLRNYIRRGLCARLARAYISRTSSINYAPSGAPSLLHLEKDLMERAWPKDDVSAWDSGSLGYTLTKSVESWVAFNADCDADFYSQEREAILEEAAGTLTDVLDELDSRDDSGPMDLEEAEAVGETLHHLAHSIHQIRPLDGSPLILPLSQPMQAPTPFLRVLCSLLAREHKPYMNPPLSAALLSISVYLTDVDSATLPAIMNQQYDLCPTSPEWLQNWETVFRNPTLLSHSRPLTKRAFMQVLQSVYDSVKDMPPYRTPLADLVYAFCERQFTGRDQPSETMWHILGDEIVLRFTEVQEAQAGASSADLSTQGSATVEQIMDLLSSNAVGMDSEEDDFVSVATTENSPSPSQAAAANTSTSSSSPMAQSDHQYTTKEGSSALPSVMSILTSLATGLPSRSAPFTPRVPDDRPLDFVESPPSSGTSALPRSAGAVVALVAAFNQLAFTPYALSEPNLKLAIRIFRVIVGVLTGGKSSRARITALQFLTRLRADRDHRVYFADAAYDPDGHTLNLASSIDRVVPKNGERERSDDSNVLQSELRRARPRLPYDGDAVRPPRGPPRFSTAASSRSRSRVAVTPETPPSLRPRELAWQIPEQLPFPTRDADTLSEALLSFNPAKRPLLPLSFYQNAILSILRHERDWEVLSYLLCHLPVQLANKHLFCGPKSREVIVKLLSTLANSVIGEQLATDMELWPQGLKPRDVQSLAYHTLVVLIGYRPCFDSQHRHLLVETFQAGLDGSPATIKCCIHALSLAAFEMPTSVARFLSRVMEKLSQIMSNPDMAVHILAFLTVVASLPPLYSNFTENDYKMVFGVALKYLQYHSRPGTSPTSSWALSQHVRLISYRVVYAWFLAVKLEDRAHYVNYITRQLLLANEGRDEIDEPSEVCFDWLARYTYASADPRPSNSLLGDIVMSTTRRDNSAEAATSEKTWVWGNSVVTIRTLARLGWVEVVSRRPSGLTKFLCRVENVPLVRVGDVDPDLLAVPASLMMGYRAPSVLAPSCDADLEATETLLTHEDIVHTFLPEQEMTAQSPPRPDSMTGYVWSGSAPSQRRKFVSVDPSFFALQLSAYPHHHRPPSSSLVTNQSSLSLFLRNLDRMPVIDTHKVGILYVAPGQTEEAEILRNAHGSPSYTRFLEGIGRLITLKGQIDVYAGGLNPHEDGEYAYAWWDDIGQVLYHTATMMPWDPHDPKSNNKKRHIGNDYVRIVWNDSGLPYRFDTLTTQFQFVNIVIEPHSLGAIAAFSNQLHENEYFKVTVQRAPRMPEFTPIGDFKLVSATKLPLLVRQLSLLADWFASVFARTHGDTQRVELQTNWQSRLQAIRRFRSSLPEPAGPEHTQGMMGQEMQRDFTNAF